MTVVPPMPGGYATGPPKDLEMPSSEPLEWIPGLSAASLKWFCDGVCDVPPVRAGKRGARVGMQVKMICNVSVISNTGQALYLQYSPRR